MNPASVKVALYLKLNAKNNIANQTQIEIAEKLQITKRTVVASISELQKISMIKVNKNVPYTNTYEVLY